MDPDALRELTRRIIGSAIKVHRSLGPGLLESSYRACLEHELRLDGLAVETERPMPVHETQILTYLRHSGCPVGLLLNFDVRYLKDGIRRFIFA